MSYSQGPPDGPSDHGTGASGRAKVTYVRSRDWGLLTPSSAGPQNLKPKAFDQP
jgi:hypothetical protein